MRYLFIHQNFPGQFRHITKALADDPANQVIGIGDARNIAGRPPTPPAVRIFGYEHSGGGGQEIHHYLRDYQEHVRRGQTVVRLLLKLRDETGFRPDVVVAHPGWGEGLFLCDIFPEARHVQYFEYFYQGTGGDIGFDPEFPSTLDDRLRVRIKNSTQLQSLVACNQGIAPTRWQQSRFPEDLRQKIAVIHEGIDTDLVRPDAGAWVEVDGERYRAGDEIVTYVARNLEPYRGFHTFMRTLPRLQELRPDARVLVVGGNDVSYGKRLADGQTYLQHYSREIGDRVDWRKVRFLGKLPYADYLKVLQISATHCYLTYPFVLSWSMLEAMAAGCLLVASDTTPVREVIEDGSNGVLVDFFDFDRLALKMADCLAHPEAYRPIREEARRTVVDRYDLKRICLPQLLSLLK